MFLVKAAALAAAALAVSAGQAAPIASSGLSGPGGLTGPAQARPAAVNIQTSTVFAIGPTDNYVAEYNGTPGNWTVIGGPARNLYVGSAGVFATDPTSGDIYQYDGTPGEWTLIGGPGNEFAEAAGHLYGLGPNDAYVAEYNGTPGNWTIVRNQLTGNIYGGSYGLFALTHDGTLTVLKYNGTPGNWSNLGGGPVSNVAVGANGVFTVSLSGENVAQWSGAGWIQIGPPHTGDVVDAIVGGGAGIVIADESDADLWKYTGTPYGWNVIDTQPTRAAEAVSANYIYGQTFANNTSTVDMYTGSGTQWTVIGGAASPPVVAGD